MDMTLLRFRSDASPLVLQAIVSKSSAALRDGISRAGEILRIADVFHPFDELAFERFLDRDVRHRCARRRAMPVAMIRRTEDHVAGANLLDGLAFALRPACAARDDENL